MELPLDHLSPSVRDAIHRKAEARELSPGEVAAGALEEYFGDATSSQEGSGNPKRSASANEETLALICRRLVSRSLVGFYLIQDGRFKYVNQRMAGMLGRSVETLTGLGPEDVVHEADWPKVRRNIERRLEGEVESVQYDFRIRRPDGEVRHVEILGSRILFDGEPAIAGTQVDVTEREEARRAYEFSEHRYKRLIEEAPGGIGLLRLGGVFREVNTCLCEITGFPREKLLETTLSELHADEDDGELLPRERLYDGETVRRECEFLCRDGRSVPVEISASRVHEDLVQIIVRDVTEHRRRERELQVAKEEAEEASRMKSAFLANMSHEIRTPITTILGFADVLASEVPPGCEEFLQAIRRSGERLLETLGSVLDLAQLEGGGLEPRPETHDLAEHVRQVVDGLRLKADRKELELEVDVPAEEFEAYVDRGLVTRILHNLVENAIKFTPEGRVTARLRGDGDEVNLIVEDTGIGMDPDAAEDLFEAFRQASRGHQREYEGTGLGLTIVRELVESMAGEIEVETEEGVGTRVTVRLPRWMDTGEQDRLSDAPRWGLDQLPTDQRVLVVEDDPSMRQLIDEMLPDTYEVDLVPDGGTALEKADSTFYDLVLLDINLTDRYDGVEVLGRMRRIDGYEDALVVAVTAYAMPGDGEAFHREGFDGYVAKPFTREDLRDSLIQIFEQ